MKSLANYKTAAAIKNDLDREGLQWKYDGYYEKLSPFMDWISFSTNTNRYSCAIPELGGFRGNDALNKYWPYVIKHYLLRQKPKFLRCSTTERQPKILSDALFDNGFIPTHQLKSNHGNYMVYLWEYYK